MNEQEIYNERIEKAARNYENSLALPEWDRKEIHGIDFKKGAVFALQNQWISVKEALPKEEKRVLVTHQYGYQVASLYKDGTHQYWGVVKESPIGANVTHWMKIPKIGE